MKYFFGYVRIVTIIKTTIAFKMPNAYLGYPVRLPEAFRIFNLDFDNEAYESGRMSYREEENYIKNMEKYFRENSTNFRIYATDKGQYIVGYRIEEFTDVWYNFCNVNNAITLLVNLKTRFAVDLTKLNANVKIVTLEPMEGEPQTVSSPEPFVICY